MSAGSENVIVIEMHSRIQRIQVPIGTADSVCVVALAMSKPISAANASAVNVRLDNSRPGIASRKAAARTARLSTLSTPDSAHSDRGASNALTCQCQNSGMPTSRMIATGSNANARRAGLASGRTGRRSCFTTSKSASGIRVLLIAHS
jgi:hypothetical protein